MKQHQTTIWRYKYKILLNYCISFGFLVLATRLFYLQIIKGSELKNYSDKNRIKLQTLKAPRGLILDRNQKVLITNRKYYEAILIPQYLDQKKQVFKKLALILNLNAQKIRKKVQQSRYKNGAYYPVSIKRQLSINEIFKLKLAALDHVSLQIKETQYRKAHLKDNGAQLFGYVRPVSKRQLKKYKKNRPNLQFNDPIGQSGIEKQWDRTLTGEKGYDFLEVNAKGLLTHREHIFQFEPLPPKPGHHIILTLDKELQEYAQKAMKRNDKIGPRRGALIAMKSNGEILAWVSLPSYDNNLFSEDIPPEQWKTLIDNPLKPLLNRPVQNHYPPGSTFKPFVALAALEEGAINENTLIDCPSSLKYGRKTYHDHSRVGYGTINLVEALERSSNVFFYKMGIQLTVDKIAKYAELFDLGKLTNIEIPYETPGLIPTRVWKKTKLKEPWLKGENLSLAVGQGFTLVTPLQMAIAYNAIATEGLLVKPMIIKQIKNHEGKIINSFSTKIIKDLSLKDITKTSFQIVKKGLEKVSNGEHGTARWWKLKKYKMAGKTGTVQLQSFTASEIYKKCENRPLHQRHHGWFVGYAPIKNPQITVAVLTENSCHGSTGSAPIARDVLEFYLNRKK